MARNSAQEYGLSVQRISTWRTVPPARLRAIQRSPPLRSLRHGRRIERRGGEEENPPRVAVTRIRGPYPELGEHGAIVTWVVRENRHAGTPMVLAKRAHVLHAPGVGVLGPAHRVPQCVDPIDVDRGSESIRGRLADRGSARRNSIGRGLSLDYEFFTPRECLRPRGVVMQARADPRQAPPTFVGTGKTAARH